MFRLHIKVFKSTLYLSTEITDVDDIVTEYYKSF